MVDEPISVGDIGWQSTNSRGFDISTTQAGMGFILKVSESGFIRWTIPEEIG